MDDEEDDCSGELGSARAPDGAAVGPGDGVTMRGGAMRWL